MNTIRHTTERPASSLRLIWYVDGGRPRARWIEVVSAFNRRRAPGHAAASDPDQDARVATMSRPF